LVGRYSVPFPGMDSLEPHIIRGKRRPVLVFGRLPKNCIDEL
jgi:hypothetical protein